MDAPLNSSLLYDFLPQQLLADFRIMHVYKLGNLAAKKTFLESPSKNTIPYPLLLLFLRSGSIFDRGEKLSFPYALCML